MEYIKDILAYESIDKCKEDLIAYKLNIISVNTDTETSTTTNNSSNNNNRNILSIKPTLQSSSELILDCKSCSVQNL